MFIEMCYIYELYSFILFIRIISTRMFDFIVVNVPKFSMVFFRFIFVVDKNKHLHWFSLEKRDSNDCLASEFINNRFWNVNFRHLKKKIFIQRAVLETCL